MAHHHHQNVPSKHLNLIMQVRMNMKWSSLCYKLKLRCCKLNYPSLNCSRSHKRISRVGRHTFHESLKNCLKSTTFLLSFTHMIQACQILHFNVQCAVCHMAIAILQDEICISLVTFMCYFCIYKMNHGPWFANKPWLQYHNHGCGKDIRKNIHNL